MVEASSLSVNLKVQMRDYLFREWADMPVNSLNSYVNGWKTWESWCVQNAVEPFQPKRIHCILFFDSLKRNGATAAKGKFNALRWLSKHLEIDLQLESQAVKDATNIPASHIERQVPPMRISFWAIFTILASAGNQVVRGVALFWLLVLAGVLRPAHVQRSSLVRLFPQCIEGLCRANKKRVDGKRRAFSWRAPRMSLLGTDVGRAAFEFAAQASEGRSYFLPDTWPIGIGLEATEWADRPMTQSKIKSLTTKIFGVLGVPERCQKQLKGLYAARRVLPTLAHRLKFGKGERLDVGAWADPGLKMPQTYSEAGLDEQADLRGELIAIASSALESLIEAEKCPSADAELEWSFTQIWGHFPKSRKAHLGECSFDKANAWCCCMFPALTKLQRSQEWDKVTSNESSQVDAEDPSDSDSSQSAGSEEASDSEKEDEKCSTEELRWKLACGKKGRLHVQHPSQAEQTVCGRTLHRAEEGEGLEMALHTQGEWSPRCWNALTAEQKEWWKKAGEIGGE